MVWNTCVLFFQILLLGGYAYAHGVTAWLGSRRGAAAYGARAAAAVPDLAVRHRSRRAAAGRPAIPQAGCCSCWRSRSACRFSRLRRPRRSCSAGSPIPTIRPRNDPYFLYAASNLGSLLALVMYPLVIEPMLRLRTQNQLWAIGYGGFVVGRPASPSAGGEEAREPIGRRPSHTARCCGRDEATTDLAAARDVDRALVHPVEPDARRDDVISRPTSRRCRSSGSRRWRCIS